MVAIGIGVGVVFGGAVPAPFSPASLSPALWLDASDATTITASSGAVSEWRDKSGNARHVSQATAANQPTTGAATQNGLNVLSFDGADVLRKSGDVIDSDMTVVSVHKVTTATSFTIPGVLLTSGGSGRPFDRWHASSDNFFILTANHVSSVNLRTWTTFASWSATYSKTTSTSPRIVEYRNNVQGTSITTTDAHNVTGQSITIGRRDDNFTTLNGQVAEVLIFPTILSAGDRTKVQTYLAAKWGL